MSSCSVQDCEKSGLLRRGWCATHYSRWQRHGDPLGGARRYTDPQSAFKARTERRGDCLVWTGSLDRHGYGQMNTSGRLIRAHRWAWEQANGPIPDGAIIDHACWNRACVEAQHLRIASKSQNAANVPGPAQNNTTGVRGVTLTRTGRYVVQVGSRRYGTYLDKGEAAAVVAEKRAEIYGEYAGADDALMNALTARDMEKPR